MIIRFILNYGKWQFVLQQKCSLFIKTKKYKLHFMNYVHIRLILTILKPWKTNKKANNNIIYVLEKIFHMPQFFSYNLIIPILV